MGVAIQTGRKKHGVGTSAKGMGGRRSIGGRRSRGCALSSMPSPAGSPPPVVASPGCARWAKDQPTCLSNLEAHLLVHVRDSHPEPSPSHYPPVPPLLLANSLIGAFSLAVLPRLAFPLLHHLLSCAHPLHPDFFTFSPLSAQPLAPPQPRSYTPARSGSASSTSGVFVSGSPCTPTSGLVTSRKPPVVRRNAGAGRGRVEHDGVRAVPQRACSRGGGPVREDVGAGCRWGRYDSLECSADVRAAGDRALALVMHLYAVKHGLDAELFVCNVMIDVYGKLGVLEEARRVFDGMKMRDLVTWNSIISGYEQGGQVAAAVEMFQN